MAVDTLVVGKTVKVYRVIMAAVLTACVYSPPAWGEDIQATVVCVRDGDSVTVRLADCDCLPQIFRIQGVRFNGCDTPEKGDTRPDIAEIAHQAKAFTEARLQPGQQILLRDVKHDKYGGRLVATVEVDGADLCRELINAGLARPYFGKGAKPW